MHALLGGRPSLLVSSDRAVGHRLGMTPQADLAGEEKTATESGDDMECGGGGDGDTDAGGGDNTTDTGGDDDDTAEKDGEAMDWQQLPRTAVKSGVRGGRRKSRRLRRKVADCAEEETEIAAKGSKGEGSDELCERRMSSGGESSDGETSGSSGDSEATTTPPTEDESYDECIRERRAGSAASSSRRAGAPSVMRGATARQIEDTLDNSTEGGLVHIKKAVGMEVDMKGVKDELDRVYNVDGLFKQGQYLMLPVYAIRDGAHTGHSALGTSSTRRNTGSLPLPGGRCDFQRG